MSSPCQSTWPADCRTRAAVELPPRSDPLRPEVGATMRLQSCRVTFDLRRKGRFWAETDMLFMMKTIATLLILTGIALTSAKAADKADAVKAAEQAWAKATVAGDEPALKQLLADDMTYTHSTGDTDSKTVFMENLKTGARKYTKIEHEGMEARIYGNTAVLTATANIATSQKGAAPAPAHLRWIHVWVMEKGRWQLVAHQSLRLAN